MATARAGKGDKEMSNVTEAKKGEVPGTVFYQHADADRGTWAHPSPQLWDGVWQVAWGEGDRPAAYEKYSRRYEDDPDES